MLDQGNRRLVFLCSGGGGNLAFIQLAISQGWLYGADIVGVLTDRACEANVFAECCGIPQRMVDFKKDDQADLLAALNQLKPDLIITTVHKILGPSIVERYRGRLINLHYSLLPAFAGTIGERPVQAALDYGVFFGGVTVHWVDETLDEGRPLVQCVIPIKQDDSVDSFMPLAFRGGCVALLCAVSQVLGYVKAASIPVDFEIGDRHCLFGGGFDGLPKELLTEAFWSQLRQSLGLSV